MPVLENPAASLNIRFQDVIDILSDLLKERNWKDFDPSSIELVYSPHYIFNYDTLIEQEVRGQTVSKGFSGRMAINAVNAELEPILTQIMDNRPIKFEKEIDSDVDYEYRVGETAITEDELKDTCSIKIASRFNVSRDEVATSAFRLVYWPMWVIYVRIPDEGTHKLIVDGVAGYPMNVESVPEREKGWVEVSKDTFGKLKSPAGWASLGKSTARATARATAGGVKKAVEKGGQGTPKPQSILSWIFKTKFGRYSVLLGILFVLIIYFFYF